jgi:type III secretion protein Q
MQMRTVRPYSWRTLDSTTRADVALLRDVRRWADRRWPLRALREAFREVIGTPVDVIVRRAKPMTSAGDFGEGIGILFAQGDLAPAAERVLVQVEQALAADLVARALRRPVPAVVGERGERAGGRPAPSAGLAGLAGALAAVLMAAARRTRGPSGEGPLRVLSAGDAASLAAGTEWPDPNRAIAVAFTVVAGDNAYSARAVFLRPQTDTYTAFAWTRPALAALGDTALALQVVAGIAEASALDVAALRCGDVLVPGTMAIARSSTGSWTGPVSLATPGSDATVRAELAEGERLVLRAGPRGPAEGPMEEHEASPALVEALGEVPIVVRVEIGRIEMLAREWAAVGEGDVLALGHPVGRPVFLRVGTHVVARGDLVEVDGEVGVRVIERFASSVTSNGEDPAR